MHSNRSLNSRNQEQPGTHSQINDDDHVYFWTSGRDTADAARILGAGFWAAIDQFTFRKSPTVEPATKWGQRLALAEMIVTPAQLALVLLALRRRLRR